ncbi:hypothetical protein PV328_006660 [Microctonus aethiopoides]|uniref:Uncharacterized protein n=1 Tax=Microctonus aethiopoides TaxID=144406 RepID=A0AA39KTS0_9HYME|nr:hypothetical protein PV328_006660 [Microctonus aethiopoides]
MSVEERTSEYYRRAPDLFVMKTWVPFTLTGCIIRFYAPMGLGSIVANKPYPTPCYCKIVGMTQTHDMLQVRSASRRRVEQKKNIEE